MKSHSVRQFLVRIFPFANPLIVSVFFSFVMPEGGKRSPGGQVYIDGGRAPTLGSATPSGANWYDPTTKMVYVVLKGDTPVTIRESAVINMGFG